MDPSLNQLFRSRKVQVMVKIPPEPPRILQVSYLCKLKGINFEFKGNLHLKDFFTCSYYELFQMLECFLTKSCRL